MNQANFAPRGNLADTRSEPRGQPQVDDTVGFMTANELVACYRAGDLSPVEATETALARLERYEPVLNAFQLVDGEGARVAAKASEARWAGGRARRGAARRRAADHQGHRADEGLADVRNNGVRHHLRI